MPEKTKESRRRSARLKGYDYSQPGAYFVTICVRWKRCVLGNVEGEEIHLNAIGNVIKECWLSLENLYEYLELDEWKVMPNHMHGIVIYHEGRTVDLKQCRGGSRTALTEYINRKSLGRIIGAFKTMSTKRINLLLDTPGKQFWQRGYYDHIIRNREELDRIRKYISENPLKWELDEYYPPKMRNA